MEPIGTPRDAYDPVCGMYLDSYPDLARVVYEDVEHLFCGEGCAARFKRDPKKFFGQPLLQLKGVSKQFGTNTNGTRVLHDINLNIWEGDFVAIIGASGSGKSTLLNMIGLLDRPTDGEILLRGCALSSMDDQTRTGLRSETFGFVFQQFNLIPWLSVYDNITLPLLFSGHKPDSSSIEGRIHRVGLADRTTHRPMELSGGEQQRVALLRALVNDPEVIIGDEPTGNLDSKTGQEILAMLIELHRTSGKTLIIVTHDNTIADRAEEVVVIKDGTTVRDQRVHMSEYAS